MKSKRYKGRKLMPDGGKIYTDDEMQRIIKSQQRNRTYASGNTEMPLDEIIPAILLGGRGFGMSQQSGMKYSPPKFQNIPEDIESHPYPLKIQERNSPLPIVRKSKQYEDGGKIKSKPEPIYTNDKNDPRLKAYNDSLEIRKQLSNIDIIDNTAAFKKYKNAYDRLTKLNGKEPEVESRYSENFKKPVQPVIYQDRPKLPEVSTLKSKPIEFEDGVMDIIRTVGSPPPLKEMTPEGHYRVTRTHTYGEPNYQVWTEGNKWKDVSKEEYDKISSEKHLTEYKLGGTMKYKGRKKLVAGGEIKLASAAMQANQLGINTLGAAQAQILGDSETDAQRISRESMSKFGKFGVAGLPLAMMDANREMKEFNRERDSYLQAQSLDYSKAARGTFRQGGTMQPGDLTYYEGLTHEEGGIPIGTDHEVEHGETSYKAPDGQRVFSEKNGYAKLSKRIERDAAMRPEDSTAQAIKEARLNRLFAKQEREKMLKEEMLSSKEGAKAYQMMRKGGRIKYSEGDIIPLKPLDINSYMPQVPQLDFIDSVPPMVQKYGPSLEWAPNTNSTPKASNPNFTTPPTTVTTSPSPSLGVSPWGNQLQPGAGYNNKVANPGFSVSKEDLKEMIGIDDTYASMGQAAQLAGPLAQGAITAADRDRYRFRQMDRTKLDTETAPNIYKQQLREQMAAMRQAIRRSTGNVGQYLGAMLASGKKGVEGARGAAVLAADLANKQAAMDFQREGANTDIINKQRMLNQGRRDMRRQNYIKSAEGVGTRTAGMVKDDLKYETDLAMAAMQLGALDGEFHNLAWETNPDGSKKGLKITRQ